MLIVCGDRHAAVARLLRDLNVIAHRVPCRNAECLQKRCRRTRIVHAVALRILGQKIQDEILPLRHFARRQRILAQILHICGDRPCRFKRIGGSLDPRLLQYAQQRVFFCAVLHHILLKRIVFIVFALVLRRLAGFGAVTPCIAPAVILPAAGTNERFFRQRRACALVRVVSDRFGRPRIRRDALSGHRVVDPQHRVRLVLPFAERFHGTPLAPVRVGDRPPVVAVCAIGMRPKMIDARARIDGKPFRFVLLPASLARKIDAARVMHADPGHRCVHDCTEPFRKDRFPARRRKRRIRILREDRENQQYQRKQHRREQHGKNAALFELALPKPVAEQRVSEIHGQQHHGPQRRRPVCIDKADEQQRQRQQHRQQEHLAANQ